MHTLYAPSVTSVRSRQNAANRVLYLGHSSDDPSLLSDPIHASPAGIFTISDGHSAGAFAGAGASAAGSADALGAGAILRGGAFCSVLPQPDRPSASKAISAFTGGARTSPPAPPFRCVPSPRRRRG